MTSIFLVDSSTDDAQARVDRSRLESVLRESGYAVVPLDAHPALASVESSQRRARVAAVVEESDAAELARLTDAVANEPKDDLDERFWGPSPDSTTVTHAVFADLSDQFAQRREVVANSVSRDEAAELLGVSAQSITARLTSKKMVGIKLGREWRLPTWQFDPDDPTGVLPDLQALQAVFPGGAVSLSRWMLMSRAEFEGRSGREQLMRHRGAAVVELARALTATGW